MPATTPESGVTRCPCCGDDFMTSDINAGTPCGDCQQAGCEATRDAGGDVGYSDCQRLDTGYAGDEVDGEPDTTTR